MKSIQQYSETRKKEEKSGKVKVWLKLVLETRYKLASNMMEYLIMI
jgi:hypothetical protein